MKLARELEKRLERMVDGLSATIFRGRLHPVDIANRLVREADLRAAEGELGPEIPNHWTVRMDPEDLDRTAMVTLGEELTHVLSETAADRGWRTSGGVMVDVVPDARIRGGNADLSGSHADVAADPWGQLLDVAGGRSFELSDNRLLVGRATEGDVQIEHAKVSRRHAIVFREGGKTWVRDLGSANGTTVNGERVGAKASPLVPGDEVGFGPATFSFRLR